MPGTKTLAIVTSLLLVASAAWGSDLPPRYAVERLPAIDGLVNPPFRTTRESASTSPFPTWHLGPCTTLHVRGRIDTDFIATSQSAANEATFGDLGDVVGLRRARIGTEGVFRGGHYVAEIDLAPGQVVVRDLFAGIGDSNVIGEYRGGHYREPFSFEGGTSANTFAFMERSPINVLDPARNWGIGFQRKNLLETCSAAVGVFRAGTDAGDFQGGDGSTIGFTIRCAWVPLNEDNARRLFHVGFALSQRVPINEVVIINQQPRSPLLNLGDSSRSPFIPVIEIPANAQQLTNLQIATARGPLWGQAEWYGTWIDQIDGGAVFYHGSYAACGWFVTGENRAFPGPNGGFGAVKVNRPFLRGPAGRDRDLGWGAWELTARFSYLDFFDVNTPLGPSGQLIGVRLPESTFGINWYLADHLRIMFNYTYALPNEPNTGTSAANEYAMRLGVFW